MLIDTHTHLYDDRLTEGKQDEMIRRALDAGIERMYMPNCDRETIPGMMRIANAFPEQCLPMMGLHPTYVKDNFEEELTIVKEWLDKERFAAVGEIGLDYYWDKKHVEQQKKAFSRQIDWAIKIGLPIVIHSRDAVADCIEMVREKSGGKGRKKLRGVFHCFSGTADEAQQIAELGFYIGIGGSLTYKSNRELQEVVKTLPLQSLLLETDAPYLAPVPFRGKRNESSYLTFIAERVAELRGVSDGEIAKTTAANARELFAM